MDASRMAVLGSVCSSWALCLVFLTALEPDLFWPGLFFVVAGTALQLAGLVEGWQPRGVDLQRPVPRTRPRRTGKRRAPKRAARSPS